jgi:ribosome biogenesis GTPase
MNEEIFDLTAIGASDDLYEALPQGLSLGRVSAVHRDQYRLYTQQGEVTAEAIGALLYRAESRAALPVVGDWVAIRETMIHAVLPRRTVFSRRAVGGREEEQVIAANIDLILIVCGLDHDYNPRRLERYVTLARESEAEAVIVLNKADLLILPSIKKGLYADLNARIEEAQRIGRGAAVVSLSAHADVEPIRPHIRSGRTIALTGSSGAGKSTIANGLLGQDRQRVSEVRETDSRGRHTTTHRELLPLPGGGALIDSPGMRELQLWAGAGSLDSAFDDIAELAAGCHFRDCTHKTETGCAVRDAIDPARLANYHKLRAEIAWHDRKENVHAALAQKQRWKAIHKAMRHGGKRNYEDFR